MAKIRHPSIFVASLLLLFIFTIEGRAHEPKQEIIDYLTESSNLDREYIEKVFSDPRLSTTTLPLSKECGQIITSNSDSYKLLEKESLQTGVNYYVRHKSIFEKTEKEYGVAPEFILAILREETYFGICLGKYYVLPQLYNLYAHNPKDKKIKKFTFSS